MEFIQQRTYMWITKKGCEQMLHTLNADFFPCPQQAGTSAIPLKHRALPPLPTCTERDPFESLHFSSMISFAWICTAVHRQAESKPAKLTRDPHVKRHPRRFPTKMEVRSTVSAHTAVEIHTTTCTISTLTLLNPAVYLFRSLQWCGEGQRLGCKHRPPSALHRFAQLISSCSATMQN